MVLHVSASDTCTPLLASTSPPGRLTKVDLLYPTDIPVQVQYYQSTSGEIQVDASWCSSDASLTATFQKLFANVTQEVDSVMVYLGMVCSYPSLFLRFVLIISSAQFKHTKVSRNSPYRLSCFVIECSLCVPLLLPQVPLKWYVPPTPATIQSSPYFPVRSASSLWSVHCPLRSC